MVRIMDFVHGCTTAQQSAPLSWKMHNDPDIVPIPKLKDIQLNPLIDTMKNACKSFYHPRRDVAVHETTVFLQGYSWDRSKTLRAGIQAVCLGWFSDWLHSGLYDYHQQNTHSLSTCPNPMTLWLSLVQPGYSGTGYHEYECPHKTTRNRIHKMDPRRPHRLRDIDGQGAKFQSARQLTLQTLVKLHRGKWNCQMAHW